MKRDKKQYRILIVEDNPGDFLIIEDLLLELITMPVITHVRNFKQAAELISVEECLFDVILLDLSLPDKSGQHLVTDIVEVTSVCPIIILTGYADIDFSIKSVGRGISDYLLKDELNASMLYKSIIYAIERRKTISQIKESEKRYSDLFNLSPQPMWVFDSVSFRFVQVNKATVDLYGYSEEEFLNMTLMDIKQAQDIEPTIRQLRDEQPGIGIFKQTVKHHKKSGEVIDVEIYSTPITIRDGVFRSVIAIDVTEKNLNEHKIIKAIIKTQEDERYEIGGELHDNVCQILAASQMSLGMLKETISDTRLPVYEKCKSYIKMALDEIRNLSHRLAPAFFDESNFEEAFSRLFKTFNLEANHKVLLHFDNNIARYPMSLDIQLNIYRILQEQLRNIVKYAKANLIEIDVVIIENKLKMSITDNGVGFEVDAVKRGIGLSNMKRRAELFSGRFEIISSPGHGCIIIVEIPLKEEAIINKPIDFLQPTGPASQSHQAAGV